MATLRIALLQLLADGSNQSANLEKGVAACRAAAAMGADIAIFPEMWNIGYMSFSPGDEEPADLWMAPSLWRGQPVDSGDPLAALRAAWQAQAITSDDPFVVRHRELARQLDMAIGVTYLERWPGAPRNTLTLFDRQGERVLTYAKVHTCGFSPMEDALTPGDAFPVARLETRAGPVEIGAMICYDREFPESARLLMLGGAEIILIPNACDMERHRLGQLRARAWENLVGVALANYAAPQHNGHSVAFDPIAFDDRGSSRDTLVVEAGSGEGIFVADFDLDALRACRLREVWGDAFRRPRMYGRLRDEETGASFVRRNRSGADWPHR